MESKNFRDIINCFYNVEQLENSTKTALEMLQNLSAYKDNQEEFLQSFIPGIFFIIFSTPNYKRQVLLIDSILASCNDDLKIRLLNHIISNFNSIPFDRKDKFYYFLGCTFFLLEFRKIVEIEDLEVQNFIWKKINEDRKVIRDWEDSVFLNFISTCKPFIAKCINNIKISETLVREYIEKDIHPINREILYSLFK